MKMPDKIFSAASYCSSGGLICTGLARTYDWFHGLDWNFIAPGQWRDNRCSDLSDQSLL